MTRSLHIRAATTRPRHVPCRRRRRQTYGISDPGTYSRTQAWWGRERWRSELHVDLHTEDVRQLRAGVGTRGPVSIRACYAVAVAISECADGQTGRNAMPGNAALASKPSDLDEDANDARARVAASTGYGLTTIQKAEQVLLARGWLVRIRSGKNWLTQEERKELWRAGSAARQRRNVWACTVPAHLNRPAAAASSSADASSSVDNPSCRRSSTDSSCDLPTTQRVSGIPSVPNNKIFKPEQASRTGPSGRPPTRERPAKRTYRADWRTVRLAKDLRARVYWLRDTPHQRIMPALDRFARANWTAADVVHQLDRVLAARSWEVPNSRVTTTKDGHEHRYPLRCPWGYLAMLLRGLEPTDLVAQREQEREIREALLNYQRLRRTGRECPHGEPAGDVPSPANGIRGCPFCRAAAD